MMRQSNARSGNNRNQSMVMGELAAKLDEALRLHQAGKLQKARKLYQQILKKDPEHSDTLHMYGLLAHQSGDNDLAIRAYRKALANSVNTAELLTNYGNALLATNCREDAIQAFKKATEINPGFALAHNNLGNALASVGQNDEAVASLRKAISLVPNYAEAYFNLGNVVNEQRKADEAIENYRQAITIYPQFVPAMNNLAKLLLDKGENEEAARLFEHVLELDNHNGVAKHLLAALQGETTATAPDEYVVGLFDGAAGYFEEHLVNELEYRVPEYLESAVANLVNKNSQLNIVDLGCGTGLCGELFRPYAKKLIGVDLAPNMLEQSRQRNVYDELIEAGITNTLHKSKNEFDLVIAADVFIYVGELKQLFSAAAASLKIDGLLAFSVEAEDDSRDYSLLTTGRYAHSLRYIRQLSKDTGLQLLAIEEKMLRKERGSEIKGHIIVLKK